LETISSEIKFATSEGIYVLALRANWSFYQSTKTSVYTGGEIGTIGFNTEGISGNGMEYGVYIGGEYLLLDNLAITLDIGPSMIMLNAQDVSSGGIEWIITTGLYWTIF